MRTEVNLLTENSLMPKVLRGGEINPKETISR